MATPSPAPVPPSPVTPPDVIRKRLNLEEEKDPELVQLAKDEGAVLLCAVAPNRAVRVSPVDEIRASIGVHEEWAIEAVIEDLETLPASKLLLLLNTPGGGLHSSFKVARAVRQSFKEIEVFVPHTAASGGTLIALIGDKIIMGPMSQLSPLDPQVIHKGRRVSALFVRNAFNRICKHFETKTKDEAPYPHQALADKLDPILMEVDHAATISSFQYAQEILKLAGYKEDEATVMAYRLVYSYPDHDSDINFTAAKDLGLRVERHNDSERNKRVWGIMRRWLGKYLYEESGTHIIRYVFPAEEKKNDTAT